MVKPILKLFRPSGSSIILVSFDSALIPNSKGNPFSGGVKYTGVGKIGDFRRKSPFISEMVRYRQLRNCNWKSWVPDRTVSFSMISSDPKPRFQGHCILTSRTSQKWCVLVIKLLKNTNRKPYTIYRIIPLSMTLSDLRSRFQGHNIFRH